MSNNERLGELFREFAENKAAIKDNDAVLRSYGYRLREFGSILENDPEYVRVKGDELLYGEDYVMDIGRDVIAKVHSLLAEQIDARSQEAKLLNEIEVSEWRGLFEAIQE